MNSLAKYLSRAATCVLVAALTFLLLGVLPPSAQAQTFSNLFDFNLQSGWQPFASVTRDPAGNLYGTTSGSGYDAGTVYRLKHVHGSWVLNSLFTFNPVSLPSQPVGWWPWSGVVIGPDGALYGTTLGGGVGGGSNGFGVVYKLMPPANVCRSVQCPWTQTALYQFAGGNDGAEPATGNVVFDPAGNLYGTTSGGGGSGCGGNGCGTVYELMPSGSGWTEKVLYSFAGGSDGAGPYAGVVLDGSGNLYGTTPNGGSGPCSGGCGTIYELSPSGSSWTEHVLYSFQGALDGETPFAGLTFDQAGNLYGGTFSGGPNGGGTVFEFSFSGGTWNLSTLYAFSPGIVGPGGPFGDLAVDGAGSLYGTTYQDGDDGAGTVFKLTFRNGAWSYSLLHTFTGGNDGLWPMGTLVLDSFGNVFGTTSEGGTQSCAFEVQCGTVWEITP